MTVLQEIIAPKENADDVYSVGKRYFSDGDKVRKNDELIDLETSKTAIIVDSPLDGYVEYLVTTGSSINVGVKIIRIHDSQDSIIKEAKTSPVAEDKKIFIGERIVSKKAERYIFNHNIDISLLDRGFVRLEDVSDVEIPLPAANRVDRPILKSIESDLQVIERPINNAKKIEIAALDSVQSTGLVSTLFTHVDDFNFKRSDNLILKSAGSNLPIITFEVAKLLKKFPILNSYYENDSIMEYTDVNIGIALDLGDGLKVYNLQNSDKLTFKDMEYEISQGIYQYFRKELKTEQIRGSTFTITDLSALGVSSFVPLINYKQSAILGISAVDQKLNRFTLSLSFDHRVTEGKTAGKFLLELSEQLMSL